MIGLFLGDTDFSEIVLRKIKRLNKKYFIIDFSKNNKFQKYPNSYRISIGKFGKIISLIKKKKSKKVLFAGKIAKPKFSTLRLDLKGIYYMPKVIKAAKLGDAAIIKSIINILSKEGIKVINSIFFNPELALKAGNYTKFKPTNNDIQTIKKGVQYFDQLNNLDHVQALIVKDNKIIATEGNQGTKNMLSKLSIFKMSKIFNGPLFLKNGLIIIASTKAIKKQLSIIIAIYFLSTIVADQIASAIFLLSTNASP